MGLSAALANAASGLAANGMATDVISANIANAQTPGYGPRRLALSANAGGGVTIDGINRRQDLSLLNDQRGASAAVGSTGVGATFYRSLEKVIGAPTDGGSLGAALSGLNTALIQAAAQPQSDATLGTVLSAAKTVAGKINAIAGAIQSARGTADQAIAKGVKRVNTALTQVAALNTQIQTMTLSGRDASSLVDKRQAVIDGIADLVPIRQVARQNGTVSLFSAGGAQLLDGTKPSVLGFTAASQMTAAQSLADGSLSGLTLNKAQVSATGSLFAGGALAAQFALRDTLGPQAQAGIDSLALDVSTRFAGADTTLAAGAAGLFTDAGASATAPATPGLAQRLTINAAADPAQGGALTRLRDGIGSSGAGPVGNGRLLAAMQTAMTALKPPASGAITGSAVDCVGLAAAFLGNVSTARLGAEDASSYAAAQSAALTTEALKNGVSTDQELQHLLVVEQSYAANARVIQTSDKMLQALMNI